MARNKKFQMYLTPREYEAIQKAAISTELTMSEIVRLAIQPVVEKYGVRL